MAGTVPVASEALAMRDRRGNQALLPLSQATSRNGPCPCSRWPSRDPEYEACGQCPEPTAQEHLKG